MHHGLSWYDVLALASFGLWPVLLPVLLLLAWYGWHRQHRHWSGWLILLPAVMAAVLVAFAAMDTA